MAWISVKERLPNNDEFVLCKNERSNPEVSWFKIQERPDEYFFMRANTWMQYKGVTHWMPLPDGCLVEES